MEQNLGNSAQKFQEVLNKYGIELKVVQFTETTKTSQDAAKVIGCDLGQIAKTIIFKGKNSGNPVCVIASGKNRINEKKIEGYLKEPIEKASPDFVLEKTGFVIGGVPPIGHSHAITIFIDQDLQKYESLWTAAGNPHTVFKLSPQELIKITQGMVISVL